MSELPAGISPKEYRRVADLIYAHAGIKLGDQKQSLVVARLARRLRQVGVASIGEYLSWVAADDGGVELTALVNALTTNTTDFFREPRHFDVLRNAAPQLATQPGSAKRGLRIWSAACSTGEEPYSIALVLAEALGLDADFRVLASDIDTNVLTTASRGTYSLQAVAPVPQGLKQRYFEPIATGPARAARVVPAVRRKVVFRRVNLVYEEFRFREPLDVIFCRNVLIYFDEAGRRKVVRKLAEQLRPGGYFFVGHAESLLAEGDLFQYVESTVYRRRVGEGSR